MKNITAIIVSLLLSASIMAGEPPVDDHNTTVKTPSTPTSLRLTPTPGSPCYDGCFWLYGVGPAIRLDGEGIGVQFQALNPARTFSWGVLFEHTDDPIQHRHLDIGPPQCGGYQGSCGPPQVTWHDDQDETRAYLTLTWWF